MSRSVHFEYHWDAPGGNLFIQISMNVSEDTFIMEYRWAACGGGEPDEKLIESYGYSGHFNYIDEHSYQLHATHEYTIMMGKDEPVLTYPFILNLIDTPPTKMGDDAFEKNGVVNKNDMFDAMLEPVTPKSEMGDHGLRFGRVYKGKIM